MSTKGKKNTVFVGLSGGVDSSVAALRLLQHDYTVVGVFIKVWQPDFLNCNWEQERLDAMRVAAKLKIPFRTFDAEEAYKKEVADYFIAEYSAGRTPNPDVMCNQHVKFGAFLDWALNNGADHVATGHYARMDTSTDTPVILRGVDTNKDQSYFLWTLTDVQRKHVLFPVGDTTKDKIRAEAEHAYLITAEKKDSQGICFLGHVDIKEFLRHFVTTEPGDVKDEKGTVVGKHDGALFYTIGQRHGFSVAAASSESKPYYVTGKDMDTNTIFVSQTKPITHSGRVMLKNLNIVNWKAGEQYQAQFRYRQTPIPVRLTEFTDDHAMLEVLTDVDTPSVGQSCVLYDNDACLGGGVISHTDTHARN